MIRPTPRAVALLACGLPVALVPALSGSSSWLGWVIFLGASLVLLAVDAALLCRSSALRLEVELPDTLFIGQARPAVLTVAGPPRRAPSVVELLPHLGPLLETQASRQVPVGDDGHARTEVPLRPHRRGTARFEDVWLRWRGPLRLMEAFRRDPVAQDLPVLPDTPRLRAEALRLFGNRRDLVGTKTERYEGEGSEFESLRKYVPGLDSRRIDWKATARHVDLMCRSYRAERNHQVVAAVDCGRLMSEPLEGVPRVDHAVTSALLLAYTGLRTGDRVGLYAFDDMPRLFLPPRGGLRTLPRLQRASAEIEYGHAASNFARGLLELDARLTRRSLVVVFTDIEDDISARLLLDNLGRLTRRHVVLFVSLVDTELEAQRDAPPRSLGDLGRSVVTGELLLVRRRVLVGLRRLGVHVLEGRPHDLPARLVNRYLSIKQRELV